MKNAKAGSTRSKLRKADYGNMKKKERGGDLEKWKAFF
jgi:hypothetical protein